MLSAALLFALIDRQLRHQPGARACLVRHAGKQARLILPIGQVSFRISASGGVEQADPAAEFASGISLTLDNLFALALARHDALLRISVSGDSALAADLSAAMDQFDWALALRPYLGDILAARAAQAMSDFGQWRAQAHESVGRSLVEYAVYEADMLVDKHAIHRFIADVDTLRDDVARLETRLKLLERRV